MVNDFLWWWGCSSKCHTSKTNLGARDGIQLWHNPHQVLCRGESERAHHPCCRQVKWAPIEVGSPAIRNPEGFSESCQNVGFSNNGWNTGTLSRPEQEESEIPAVLRGSYSMGLEAQIYFVMGLSYLYSMPFIVLHPEMKEGGVFSLMMNGEAWRYRASYAKALYY